MSLANASIARILLLGILQKTKDTDESAIYD